MITNPDFDEVVNGKRGMLQAFAPAWKRSAWSLLFRSMTPLIDALAALTRHVNRERATRIEFKQWVKKYLLPYIHAKVSEHDVYAARCGVLHAYSMHSDISRSGRQEQSFTNGAEVIAQTTQI